jgi:hypothetical protein
MIMAVPMTPNASTRSTNHNQKVNRYEEWYLIPLAASRFTFIAFKFPSLSPHCAVRLAPGL